MYTCETCGDATHEVDARHDESGTYCVECYYAWLEMMSAPYSQVHG